VPVSKDGALLPETIDVLKVIKKYNLTLATGHSSAEEDLMLVRERASRALIASLSHMPCPLPST
jgi:hypothetical protein